MPGESFSRALHTWLVVSCGITELDGFWIATEILMYMLQKGEIHAY
jgi:hypothetical protein